MIKVDIDSIKINGPQVDGGYTISLKTGEYSQEQISQLLMIPQNTVVTVQFDYDGNK